jgi:molecular chaperone DnaK
MRTAATIDSIPASHSVGIEVLDKLGGAPVLDYLVRSGDTLPKQGQRRFRAAATLNAGESNSLNFKLWEGDITFPITDNRSVGVMKISGTDFEEGTIQAGADIDLSYEMSDDGNIRLEITIPSIYNSFNSGKNFYSRQEGQRDYSEASMEIVAEARRVKSRADNMAGRINDQDLYKIREKLEQVLSLADNESDPEKVKESEEKILQAKRDLASVRKRHLKEVRQLDLDRKMYLFDGVKKDASPTEISSFDNLVVSAKRVIDKDTPDFDGLLSELSKKVGSLLWKQDWFILDVFKHYTKSPFLFKDKALFKGLVARGEVALQNGVTEE